MSTTETETIIAQLTRAIAARQDSLRALRARLIPLIEPLPIGVTLADDAGEIGRIRRICTGASQWSNRTWEVTITGKALIVAGKMLVVDCERSYHDGHNLHTRTDEPFCLGSERDEEELSWLSGHETRALALRLPAAIARYSAECSAETEANTITAAAI